MSEDKSHIRRVLRLARLSVPDRTRRQAGRNVMRLALRERLLRRRRRIGFYMPAKSELDVLPMLNRALWLGAECYLPVVPGRGNRRLWFARLGDQARHWSLNRFDILEYGRRLRRVRVQVLDVLFMPLLGFDARGYRMGMGGGYYDTTLSYQRRTKHWHRPKLVGVGFEVQRREMLPVDPWDIPLDRVITEKRIYRFRRA